MHLQLASGRYCPTKGEDGSKHPVVFASRTLSRAEQNYAQIEREGLAVVFGVPHLHKYLYGIHFTLVSDHKMLLTLFNEKMGCPLYRVRVSKDSAMGPQVIWLPVYFQAPARSYEC